MGLKTFKVNTGSTQEALIMLFVFYMYANFLNFLYRKLIIWGNGNFNSWSSTCSKKVWSAYIFVCICHSQLIINKHHVHLMHDVISGVNMENCEHPCVGEPCQNGGECLPKEDTYMCLCPLGFKGHSCHRGELNFGSSCSKHCVEKKVVLKSSFECKKYIIELRIFLRLPLSMQWSR